MDEGGCGCVIVAVVYLLGMCIAVAISWEANHSVLWASLHGILSWVFIIYHFFF